MARSCGPRRLLALVCLLAGCTVGPDYRTPEMPLPERFSATAGVESGVPDARWWEAFGDPRLTVLVEQAVARNHDLRVAAANLQAARALLRESRYARLPAGSVGASATREQRSGSASFSGAPGVGRPETFYDAGFDAAWELDLFGGLRRVTEALGAEYQAEEARLQDTLITVAAEVARSYLELRGLQYRLAVARTNLENQQQTYDLTVALREAGRGTDFDTARALSQLETTRAGIPPLKAELAATAHRLNVLTGAAPAESRDSLLQATSLPRPPTLLDADDPSAWLRRRPDIRAAERRLAAATARQGVAVADLFPQVTLTGSAGYQSTDLDDLGDSASERFAIGPSLRWGLLNLGRSRARIDASDARAEAALAGYEQTVLRALEDAENALARYAGALARSAGLRRAADASREAAGLASLRYRNGADGFLAVLDAEARQLEAQDRSAQADTEAATAAVAVYKAFGGGWEPWLPPAR